MFYVYILYSERKQKYYKGHTSNLEDRLHRHNSGNVKATQKGIPWVLVFSIEKESRGEAYQLEMKLKNLTVSRLLKFIQKYKFESRPANDDPV